MTTADEFERYRPYLLSVGYRTTGSLADAEDAVQEAWIRLQSAERDAIEDLQAWLTTVVARVCLDRLKSAAVRRETYVGQWLPEPVVTGFGVTEFGAGPSKDPLDLLVRGEEMRIAAMVVLDALAPDARVAFVLHDGFAMPFDEIADILGVTSAAARQQASRARRTVAQAPAPTAVTDDRHNEAVGALLAALASGDVQAVVAALHPQARMIGDAGGTTRTAINVLVGAEKVARFYLGLLTRYGADSLDTMQPALVNGQLGVTTPGAPGSAGRGGFPARVVGFTVVDGKVWAAYDFANPAKISGVTPAPTEPGTPPPPRSPAP